MIGTSKLRISIFPVKINLGGGAGIPLSISGNPNPGELLTVSGGNSTYQWQINGINVVGATNSTFVIPYTIKSGDLITVVDGNGIISNPIIITTFWTADTTRYTADNNSILASAA